MHAGKLASEALGTRGTAARPCVRARPPHSSPRAQRRPEAVWLSSPALFVLNLLHCFGKLPTPRGNGARASP